jgi:hypothetical protein
LVLLNSHTQPHSHQIYETEVIVNISLQATIAAALAPLSGQVATIAAALAPLSGQVATIAAALAPLSAQVAALDGRLGALENSIAVQAALGFNGSATSLEHTLLPVPNNTGALPPGNLHFPQSFGDILGHDCSLTAPQLHALLQFYGADLHGVNVSVLRTTLARIIGIRRV